MHTGPACSHALQYFSSPQNVVNITLQVFKGHSVLLIKESGLSLFLEWRDKDSFQTSARGVPAPCMLLADGHIGTWVDFHRNLLGKIEGLTVPGIAYGLTFTKQ